jgi:hypothetical protein
MIPITEIITDWLCENPECDWVLAAEDAVLLTFNIFAEPCEDCGQDLGFYKITVVRDRE